MRKPTVLFLAIGLGYFSTGYAQDRRISVGISGGVDLTKKVYGDDESRRYIIGPAIEVKLPGNFAVEASALYQRIGFEYRYASILGNQFVSNATRVRGNRWQFPLLGKYYLPVKSRTWTPYIGTGYTLAETWFHQNSTVITTDSATNVQRVIQGGGKFTSGLDVGATAAAGVRIRMGKTSLLPEIRYTHWGNRDYSQRPNQAAFMLGLRF